MQDSKGPEVIIISDLNTTMIPQLRSMAIRSLERMYRPEKRLFVFCVRRAGNSIISEGLSRRYTAIVLIGLAGEEEDVIGSVLAGQGLQAVCNRLKKDVSQVSNPGDVALTLWALCSARYPDRQAIRVRLLDLLSARKMLYPTVEISWALDSLCMDSDVLADDLVKSLARRLMSSFNAGSGMFPHILGNNTNSLRSHVSCFADMVYPIHALANYAKLSGDREALDIAVQCAERICRLQGPAGQWWWHYDRRTGDVIERYPVYSVHQDAMAPMALFAVQEAGGPDFIMEVQKGLDWLVHSPEHGASLIDNDADIIWRKVARHEPGKLSRYAQTIMSRVHPALRVPGIDLMFPPGAVDYENRPYHSGWLLYAWPKGRIRQD